MAAAEGEGDADGSDGGKKQRGEAGGGMEGGASAVKDGAARALSGGGRSLGEAEMGGLQPCLMAV